MTNKRLVFSFADLAGATTCRDALVGAGFPASRIELQVIKDEAGPGEGNFAVGNGRAVDGGRSSGVISGGEIPYDANFARPRDAATCLVVFTPTDDEQYERALRFVNKREDLRPTGTPVSAADAQTNSH